MVRNLPATTCDDKVHRFFQDVLRYPFKEADVLQSVDIVNEGGPADASKTTVLVFGHHIAASAAMWIDTIDYKDTELDIGRPDNYNEAQSDPADHIEVVGDIFVIDGTSLIDALNQLKQKKARTTSPSKSILKTPSIDSM